MYYTVSSPGMEWGGEDGIMNVEHKKSCVEEAAHLKILIKQK